MEGSDVTAKKFTLHMSWFRRIVVWSITYVIMVNKLLRGIIHNLQINLELQIFLNIESRSHSFTRLTLQTDKLIY